MYDANREVRMEGCRMVGSATSLPFSILALTMSKKSPNSAVLIQNRMTTISSFLNITSEDGAKSVMDPNLCFGVFVHATEDEFEAVRYIAVNSIFRLGFTTSRFAQLAIQQLIGFLN
jgi:hypothetical protein